MTHSYRSLGNGHQYRAESAIEYVLEIAADNARGGQPNQPSAFPSQSLGLVVGAVLICALPTLRMALVVVTWPVPRSSLKPAAQRPDRQGTPGKACGGRPSR